MSHQWGRLLTAMVTPFDKSGEVDYAQAGRLANYLLDNGSEGVVVAGTTGESPTITHEEQVKLFETVVNAVGKRGLVIAGTGSNNTKEAIWLAEGALKAGVDGLMLVSPYYNKPTQEGIYQHMMAVADKVDLPIIVYNIPGRTSINIEVETLFRLAKAGRFVAVKEASGNMTQIADTIAQAPEGFLVYSGDDLLTLPILSMGGHGVISVTSHVVGNDLAKMIKAHFGGDPQTAASLHQKMIPIVKAMFCASNPSPTKYTLNKQGFEVGGTRLPLVDLSEKEAAIVDKAISEYGLLKAPASVR